MRAIINRLTRVLARTDDLAPQAEADTAANGANTLQMAESAALLRQFLEANTTVLNHDPGALRHFAAPARLRPVIPLPGQGNAGSWIGGLPMLPDDMPWPVLEGKPALFLAQIDCSDLPSGIWGGMGPRNGWLVFFVAQDDRVFDVCVRHVDGPLVEQQPPSGLVYPTTGYTPSPLSDWIRPDPGAMPRWPVIIEPVKALPDQRGMAQKMDLTDSPRHRLYGDLRMRDELMPFDWVSALLLLYVIDEKLENGQGTYQQRIAKAEAGAQTQEAARLNDLHMATAATQSKLARLIQTAERTSGRAAYGDQAGALILEALHRIKRPIEVSDEDGKKIVHMSVIADSAVMRHYLPLAEIRARYLYVSDPDLLPPLQRAHFEGLWTSDVRYEHGHMGGRPGIDFHDDMTADPVALVVLPTSDLVGWMWGDMDDLGIFIPPDALKAGDWDRAWGAVSNG